MNMPHANFTHCAGKRVHLGVCGSVAAYRMPDVLRWWIKAGIDVSATLTKGAQQFISPLTFEALGAHPVYGEMFSREHVFGHLEPGQTADTMVIAPASATTLARLAHGNADDMLACQVLAFAGPCIIAPAMNPRMWEHPATIDNVAILQRRGARIIVPDVGGTACGEEGQGRLADVRHIYLAVLQALAPQDMQGQRVLVTLGPTREYWDAVRFWSNPSTGIMGAALALAAWLRGAQVDAICGPCMGGVPWLPSDICQHHVVSASQMYTVAESLWARMDIGIFTAAVADFHPESCGEGKFKKTTATEGLNIHFTPNKDILHTLAARRTPGQKILGFAAEHVDDAAALARAVHHKLRHKGADILAGNRINQEGSGFGSTTNSVCVVDTTGREEHWSSFSKADVAWRLCSWLNTI